MAKSDKMYKLLKRSLFFLQQKLLPKVTQILFQPKLAKIYQF